MQTYRLTAHPAHPPVRVSAIEARVIGFDADWLRIRWRIEGAQALVIPPFAGRGRADGLWQTTCFEMFLMPEGSDEYVELNLSPSERWAAYDFTGHRAGMSDRSASREPDCAMRQGSTFAIFDAAIPGDVLPSLPAAMGITAVIEEEAGVKSFWALTHPDAGDPDFHDASCFVAELAPPRRA